jgi:SAM-dependent methyltransferase
VSVFSHYARYYDLLYGDKDYAGETQFVHEQLLQRGGHPGRLLELGCGTGRHAVEFAKLGWSVTGYDLSEDMVKQALERAGSLPPAVMRKLKFAQGDLRDISDEQTYDSVVALFHVMSYQTTDEDLQSALATAAAHLKPGGNFLFDFWYGPAVLSDSPVVRVKRLEDDRIEVTRLAEPEMYYNENLVLVNYHIFITEKPTRAVSEFRELHRMRYWFLPELRRLLGAAGLRLSASGLCYADRALGKDTWYGWLMAEKNKVPPSRI